MYIQRVICAYITTVYIPVWFSDPFKGQATSNVWGSSWVTLNILEYPGMPKDIFDASDLSTFINLQVMQVVTKPSA